jgi:uncharacterized protein with HEPN domain
MYLHDVLEAGDRIVRQTQGLTTDQFASDPDRRLICERCFEIIGEAVRQLLQQRPDLAPRIPEAPRIIALRNIVIHAYFLVDPAVLLDVAQRHLPPLLGICRTLLNELGGPNP